MSNVKQDDWPLVAIIYEERLLGIKNADNNLSPDWDIIHGEGVMGVSDAESKVRGM